MKKLLFLLLLIPGVPFSEETPPFEVKDPAITENFRNIYYAVDQLPNQFIQNTSVNQSGATFNVSSGTVQGEFNVSRSTTLIFGVFPDSYEARFAGNNTNTNSAVGTFRIRPTITGTNAIIRFSGGSTKDPIIYRAGSNDNFSFGHTDGANTSTGLVISNVGEVTQPLQPSFLTQNSNTANATGDGTAVAVTFATEIFDQGSDFATNTFTAPVTGRYQLNTTVYLNQIDGNSVVYLTLITSNRTYYSKNAPVRASDTNTSISQSVLADMDANDTATVTITGSGGTKVWDIDGNGTYFSGSLIN